MLSGCFEALRNRKSWACFIQGLQELVMSYLIEQLIQFEIRTDPKSLLLAWYVGLLKCILSVSVTL